MKRLVSVCWLVAATAWAQTPVVGALESKQVPLAQVQELAKEVARILGESLSWPVRVADVRGVCAPNERTCLLEKAQQIQAEPAVLLQALSNTKLRFYWVWPAEKSVKTFVFEGLDAAAVARKALELFPSHARRGVGGLTADVPVGTTLRLDGGKPVAVKQGQDVPVATGVHELELTSPEGNSVLHLVSVQEGSRQRLSFPLTASAVPESGQSTALRRTAYGLWSGAAVAVGAALLCGGLSRYALRDRGLPCSGADRDCNAQTDALAAQGRAHRYARNANIFAAVGAGLALGGGAVFAWDFIAARKK